MAEPKTQHQTKTMQKRTFAKPDESREFSLGRLDLVTLEGVTFGRIVLQPGWRWSASVKPIAKTELCESSHLQVIITGRIHVVMSDGSEMDFAPGDLVYIPPGHDAWVVGNDTLSAIDITGMADYAKR